MGSEQMSAIGQSGSHLLAANISGFDDLTDCLTKTAPIGAWTNVVRHTAVTWLMQRRADKVEAAGHLGMTLETLEIHLRAPPPGPSVERGCAFSKRRPKAA